MGSTTRSAGGARGGGAGHRGWDARLALGCGDPVGVSALEGAAGPRGGWPHSAGADPREAPGSQAPACRCCLPPASAPGQVILGGMPPSGSERWRGCRPGASGVVAGAGSSLWGGLWPGWEQQQPCTMLSLPGVQRKGLVPTGHRGGLKSLPWEQLAPLCLGLPAPCLPLLGASGSPLFLSACVGLCPCPCRCQGAAGPWQWALCLVAPWVCGPHQALAKAGCSAWSLVCGSQVEVGGCAPGISALGVAAPWLPPHVSGHRTSAARQDTSLQSGLGSWCWWAKDGLLMRQRAWRHRAVPWQVLTGGWVPSVCSRELRPGVRREQVPGRSWQVQDLGAIMWQTSPLPAQPWGCPPSRLLHGCGCLLVCDILWVPLGFGFLSPSR